jgi:hypothetical protein
MYYLCLLYVTYSRHNRQIALVNHSMKTYSIQSTEIDNTISTTELEAGMHGSHFSYQKPIWSYLKSLNS